MLGVLYAGLMLYLKTSPEWVSFEAAQYLGINFIDLSCNILLPFFINPQKKQTVITCTSAAATPQSSSLVASRSPSGMVTDSNFISLTVLISKAILSDGGAEVKVSE